MSEHPARRTRPLPPAGAHAPEPLLPVAQLPSPPAGFIGRERELAALRGLLWRVDARLVTLTGPPGAGKTRLALQVAASLRDDFPDGVFFVALAPITDPSLVVPAIARALGVQETAGQPLPQRLAEALRGRALLVVLDNFEQVMAAALPVADLLSACPRLKVLVTSRQTLRIYGEYEFPVLPLALPDLADLPPLEALTRYEAVRLFIARALAAKPDFAVTAENAGAIAAICHRLDGLPLAIELAAARIKLLSPAALQARLDQASGHSSLELLTGGARDLPVRHQTLRNAIASSYDLLDSEEQRLFRQLAVFVGGCGLEAAEHVLRDAALPIPYSVLAGLVTLK